MQAFDCAISLGVNCQTISNISKKYSYSKSLPFDWWNTPMFAIKRLMESNFCDLVHTDYLRISHDRATVTHAHYGIFFHHDFPREHDTRHVLPLNDETIEIVRVKYERRVARLLNILRSDYRKLLIRYDSPEISEWIRSYVSDIWEDVAFEEIMELVCKASKTRTCEFAEISNQSLQPLVYSSGIPVTRYHIPNDQAFPDWQGNLPEWQNMLSNYVVGTLPITMANDIPLDPHHRSV